jgi:uridine kinase
MPSFVAIVGPVASGKTSLSQDLQQKWPDLVEVIRVDNYYKDRSNVPMQDRTENGEINYDLPDAIDFDLLLEHLHELERGVAVFDAPSYDFTTHTRSLDVRIDAKPVVIVDGHQLLCGIPRTTFPWNYTIFVDTPLDLCFERRLLRDTSAERTFYDVSMQHFYRTLPAHMAFGIKQRADCDLVSSNTDAIKQVLVAFILLKTTTACYGS